MAAPVKGIVIIKVVSATDLKPGNKDLYVIITKDGENDKKKKVKTQVSKDSVSPLWNEVFKVNLSAEDTIVFKLKVRNRLRRNTLLGQTRVAVEPLTKPSQKPHNLKLDFQDGVAGQLNVKVVFIVESKEPEFSGQTAQIIADRFFNTSRTSSSSSFNTSFDKVNSIDIKPTTPIVNNNDSKPKYSNYIPQPYIQFKDVVTQESQWNRLALELLTSPEEQGWKALGTQLGKTTEELETVEKNNTPDKYVKTLLNEWKNIKKEAATVDALLNALKTIDNYTTFQLVVSWLDSFKCVMTQDEPKPFHLIKKQNFEKGDLIGEGTFARVFKGTWFGVPVAMKELQFQNESAKENFLKEVGILTRCHFPNIVRFYGAFTEMQYLIFMELAPKGSLLSVLSNNSELLPWSQRYQIAIGIARGLQYLHTNNIIHGNLKSSNILLDEEYQPKLTDFGLARTKEGLLIPAPNAGSVGSARWLAPEICRKQSSHTKASDVFSAGMILWELATRKIPYAQAQTDAIVTEWIQEGGQEVIPDAISEPFKQTILCCWKEASERPTAEGLCQSLCAIAPPRPKHGIKSLSTIVLSLLLLVLAILFTVWG